jgi:5S rRNA maturation endonuclease (ribonuclease M5)
MIHSRQSEDTLTKEGLLSKVSEYQIFKYYCPPFDKPNKKFKSDLRKDRSPTVSIAMINTRLKYKDFGHPDHTFDCFAYVGYKYNLNFRETLKHIDQSFCLGLSAAKSTYKAPPKLVEDIEITESLPVNIHVKCRDWNKEDAKYWKQFHISKRILRIFDVKPITHYWINEQRFSCNSISYRYRFDCGYKIYRPLESDFKWSSNVGSHCLQGYNELPETGDQVFLTSSLKDVMCLASFGHASFALQSEMLMPNQKTIDEIKERFKKVIVLYDNDFDKLSNPGQKMADKICRLYGLSNLKIPSHYKSKDISDVVKNNGIRIAKNVIKNLEGTNKARDTQNKIKADRNRWNKVPF